MRSLLALLVALSAVSAHAADRYVRPGATGNGSGTDWANAYPSLPSSLNRGDTYWLADGNYGSRSFNEPTSGTATITLKKATPASHGTNTGWSDAYGGGQATFTNMDFASSHYVIDGSKRNESNWADSASYGIRNSGSLYSSRLASSSGNCADNLTFRYVDVGAPVGSGVASAPSSGLYLGGFGSGSLACENWTVHRSHIHNTKIHVQCAGCNGLLVEYTYFGTGWGKEAIRGQVYASNMVVRNSIFKDSCQRDPADSTSGCTAEIALWDGSGFDNNEVYGNVFYKTTNEINTGGVVVIGGNGVSWVGPGATNAKVFNNTISGYKDGTSIIVLNGTGNTCRNNLWYGNTVGTGCAANTSSNNAVLSSSVFVSAGAGDFRLASATQPGTQLASPYDIDLKGTKRGADGNWDVGAHEYSSSSAVQLAAPTNLTVR
jgi:hypothetical protein